MIFKNFLKKSRGEDRSPKRASPKRNPRDIEHTALFQVSSAIGSKKDLPTIFEIIGREAGRCLKASRSTVYLADGTRGIPRIQFTYSPDSTDERLGIFEEKELARRAITEKRPYLLKDPKDFSNFFKHGSRERKITSLMSIPFGFEDRVIGTLSLSRLNGEANFTERDLQFSSIFSNHASIALQKHHLIDELRKAALFRKNYEQYLDDLADQLQNLPVEERRRIDEHIGRFLSGFKTEKQSEENEKSEDSAAVNGVKKLIGEISIDNGGENLPEKVQVEIKEPSKKSAADPTGAGAFIPTAFPRDLGEEFVLKLYPPEGQPMEVLCKVIFTNKYGKESENLRRGMGIKFLDPSPEVQRLLGEYIPDP